MKSPENTEKLIRNAEIRSNPNVNQAVLEDLMKEFDVTEGKQKASVTLPRKRRTIMKSPITKVAVAAVIIIAVTFGLFEFIGTGNTSGVAWAEVAQKVKGTTGMVYRTKQTQTMAGLGRPIERNEITYYSLKYGMKVENYPGEEKTITTCLNFTDKTIILLMHSLKKYTQGHLPEIPEDQGQAIPEEIVQRFLSGEYKELGQQTIEGVLVEGIEVDNPSGDTDNASNDRYVYRLWVSVETGYPVMLEADVVAKNGDLHIEMTMDQFQWNMELDPSVFKVDIPSDYTLMEMPQS